MFILIEKNLMELSGVLNKLSQDEFTTPVAIMDQATIGQHSRHILEIYDCLIQGYNNGLVNYDKRQRSYVLENSIDEANNKIAEILTHLPKEDKTIMVEIEIDSHERQITSTYYRELLYNIEHCIHHQALIKAAINAMGLKVCDENFGVAQSTIKYRATQCAH